MAEDVRAELALGGLVDLLERVGEEHWAKWAAGHLEHARELGTIDPGVLDAYGGMGSFNDLMLDPVNGHRLERMQIPWANQLLAVLGERVYRLALEATDGGGDQGWARPPDPPLDGARCSACGYCEITDYEIEWWVARILVPAHVGDETLAADPGLLDVALEGRLIGAPEIRGDAMQRGFKSGVSVTEREGPLLACPACGSEEVLVHRWVPWGEFLISEEDNTDA